MFNKGLIKGALVLTAIGVLPSFAVFSGTSPYQHRQQQQQRQMQQNYGSNPNMVDSDEQSFASQLSDLHRQVFLTQFSGLQKAEAMALVEAEKGKRYGKKMTPDMAVEQVMKSNRGVSTGQGQMMQKGGSQYNQGSSKYNTQSGSQYNQGGSNYNQGGSNYDQGGSNYNQGGSKYSGSSKQYRGYQSQPNQSQNYDADDEMNYYNDQSDSSQDYDTQKDDSSTKKKWWQRDSDSKSSSSSSKQKRSGYWD